MAQAQREPLSTHGERIHSPLLDCKTNRDEIEEHERTETEQDAILCGQSQNPMVKGSSRSSAFQELALLIGAAGNYRYHCRRKPKRSRAKVLLTRRTNRCPIYQAFARINLESLVANVATVTSLRRGHQESFLSSSPESPLCAHTESMSPKNNKDETNHT